MFYTQLKSLCPSVTDGWMTATSVCVAVAGNCKFSLPSLYITETVLVVHVGGDTHMGETLFLR